MSNRIRTEVAASLKMTNRCSIGTLVRLWAIGTAAALSACGGGNGSGSRGDAGAVVNENPAGSWIGSFGIDGLREIELLIDRSGYFVGSVSASGAAADDTRLVEGFAIVDGNNFSAFGNAFATGSAAFPSGERVAALTIAFGELRSSMTLTAVFSAGGEQAKASTSFVRSSGLVPSLAALSGIYTLYPANPIGSTATVAIDSAGVATYNTSDGCVGNGSFSVPTTSVNIYRWALTGTQCPGRPTRTYSGLARIDASPSGGNDNRLTMYGSSGAEQAFSFVGTKP